jgi:hypothetical protein
VNNSWAAIACQVARKQRAWERMATIIDTITLLTVADGPHSKAVSRRKLPFFICCVSPNSGLSEYVSVTRNSERTTARGHGHK